METIKTAPMNVALAARLQGVRTAACSQSLGLFAANYLGHHVQKPLSPMHRDLHQLLEQLPTEGGARLALAAPRGHAKSTLITLIFVLWCICYRRRRFIVLISDTAEKAAGFLDHIKYELLNNAALAKDFPMACEPQGRRPRPPRWRDNEIITSNDVRITALGAGQNIRGRRHLEVRPDLIILDDVESPDNTRTPESRSKLEKWFNRSILKAGNADTQVVAVGTIQHYDSLLATLTNPQKSPTWASRIYRAVIAWSAQRDHWQSWADILRGRSDLDGDIGPKAARGYFERHADEMLNGTDVLWPEMEDYYSLMLKRETEGPANFDAEKQNNPVNPEDCVFMEEDFQFWDDRWHGEDELFCYFGGGFQIVGACDPSLGRHGRHADDSAIITIARHLRDGTLYVLDADLRRRRPDEIIEAVLTYQELRGYSLFGFETNQFQEFLAQSIERQGAAKGNYVSVHPIQNCRDKIGRIQSLQPLIRSGRLQFCRRHTTLLDQLRFFPKAGHDDGPDALEMAVRTIEELGLPEDDDIVVIDRGETFLLGIDG